MDELVIRRVSYGLELVDQLTQGPLVGASRVSFEVTGTWSGPEPTLYRVNRSRWVFEEDLQGGAFSVVFTVEADFYQTQIITVLDANLTGTIQKVEMVPVVGYPFTRALTRVIGLARHSSGIPVPGAQVDFTQHFVIAGSDPPTFIGGPALDYTTFTDESGQYVAWFTPEALSDPNARPTAARFDATATGTVDLGSGPVSVTGSISDQDLIAETLNNADIINMS
jgi:hypothetical protein